MDGEGDNTFVAEEVEQIVKNVIQTSLKNTIFSPSKVDALCDAVTSGCIKGLLNLNKAYKYAATCVIHQKTGAGMVTGAAKYWDAVVDGMCKVVWENETMQCIVTIFGISVKTSGSSRD